MRLRPRLALLLIPALMVCAGCQQDEFHGQTNVVVLNVSKCTVSVSVDGWEATSVEPNEIRTVDNVGAGRHVLEAKDGVGRLIERRYVELGKGESFHWRLETCPPR